MGVDALRSHPRAPSARACTLKFQFMWGRIAEGTVGLLSIYCAGCVYPDERKRLHNRLDELYVRISDARQGQHSLVMRTLGALAGLAERFFNAVWGPALFSLRAVCVSLSASLATLLISAGQTHYKAIIELVQSKYGAFLVPDYRFISFREISYGIIFSLLTLLQAVSPARWRIWYPLLVLVGTVLVVADIHSILFGLDLFERIAGRFFTAPSFNRYEITKFELSAMGLAIVTSTSVDLCVVAITRTGLRWLSDGASVLRTTLVLAINAAVCLPIYYFLFFYRPSVSAFIEWMVYPSVWERALPNVIGMCQIDAGICAAIVVVAVAVVINRLVWFLAERALYGLADAHILDKKVWLWTIGLGMLADAGTGYFSQIIRLFAH
jgi:hypothetical protein